MPFRRFLSHHTDDEAKQESKFHRSPRTPKSPKSPKSPNFSKIQRNYDYVDECEGCRNVTVLIRRNLGPGSISLSRVPHMVLHNNFDELDKCANNCLSCRVFRQALVLEEVTFDGIKGLRETEGQVIIRWEESMSAYDGHGSLLLVDIQGYLGRRGIVLCNSHDPIQNLALQSDPFDPAVLEQINGWLRTCTEDHIGHCENLKWSNENPKYLVEILSHNTVRLCQKKGVDYVALSYCWGDTPDLPEPEKKRIADGKTLSANLDQRLRSFEIDSLPATVCGSLRFIYALGVRYAWIDTLCILQDKPDGVTTMHKVYSNALFTICACSTTRATSNLFDTREAWTQLTKPCRLGGQWLATLDMSLNELRLRSPLAERAWTLQEERLSPRMLYISSNRMYWSCAKGDELEMKPAQAHKSTSIQRPVYPILDRDTEMPLAQKFLLACWVRRESLHPYWTDIVKSYSRRSMGNLSDRLRAVSGLAARYLSASNSDEYLAGIWAKSLAEDLSWRVKHLVEMERSEYDAKYSSLQLPSWSWAALPIQTAIEMEAQSARSPFFARITDHRSRADRIHSYIDDPIKLGEEVKEICLTGRLRALWGASSTQTEWSAVSRFVKEEEKFSFAKDLERNAHAVQISDGRVLVYEDRKREVVGQLDFRWDVQRVLAGQVELWAFELGVSSMLLLEYNDDGSWRRVGVAWDVRQDYFASAQTARRLTLR